MSSRRTLGSTAGLMLAVLAALGAVLILAPSLTRAQWIARLIAREASLEIASLAALALALLRRGGGRMVLAARVGSLAALAVGLVAFASPLATAWSTGTPFSLLRYVTWGGPAPTVSVERDLVLDPARPSLAANLWRGAGAAPRPFLVVVHGGSWRGGDKGEGEFLFREFAAAGYSVLDVRYRLAPADGFPAGIADVKCLLGRFRESAARFGVDPDRAALFGRSAGAQVAIIAAYSAGDARLPPSCAVEDRPVRAAISLYGPNDLVWGFENPMVPDVVSGNQSLRVYLGGTPSDRAEAYRLGSALAWADRALPPTLLIHGLGDQIVRVDHSRHVAAGLRERGRSVELVEVPFGEHGFDVRPGGVGEQITRHVALRFLAKALGPGEALLGSPHP